LSSEDGCRNAQSSSRRIPRNMALPAAESPRSVSNFYPASTHVISSSNHQPPIRMTAGTSDLALEYEAIILTSSSTKHTLSLILQPFKYRPCQLPFLFVQAQPHLKLAIPIPFFSLSISTSRNPILVHLFTKCKSRTRSVGRPQKLHFHLLHLSLRALWMKILKFSLAHTFPRDGGLKFSITNLISEYRGEAYSPLQYPLPQGPGFPSYLRVRATVFLSIEIEPGTAAGGFES